MKRLLQIIAIVLTVLFISGCSNSYNPNYWNAEMQKAADSGDKEAQYYLASALVNGLGTNCDEKKALEIYKRLANEKFGPAVRYLGVIYEEGKFGVAKDSIKANELYNEAFTLLSSEKESNSPLVYRSLGQCYKFGQGVDVNVQEAIAWYQKAAELGDAGAMFNLGVCYYNGDGVSQSYAEATEWYKKATELEEPRAMYNLGYCYEKGNGVGQSYEKAVEWYRKAADLGNAEAMSNLGYCYDKGLGTFQSDVAAVKWYKEAAELGDARAMSNLGYCYEKGRYVDQSYAKAVEWYKKAAELGNAVAMNNLGAYYANIEMDEATAVQWYRKAAEKGDGMAMVNLGSRFYNEGKYAEAEKWARKAVQTNPDNESAREFLKAVMEIQALKR